MKHLLKTEVLSKLYHDLGKQHTNFALQRSWIENDEHRFTKRRTFLELDPEKDDWFIQECNHRQILLNEIVIDLDRPIPREHVLEDKEIQGLIGKLVLDHWRFCIYHTGSKGVHIHVYFDGLMLMKRDKREEVRMRFLKKLGLTAVDFQKASDAVMIALEHTPHWKTGQLKLLIYNHGVTAWS